MGAWRQCLDFFGLGGEATYLWPRWLILRAVGLVYVLVFSGIINEGRALIGPRGIVPLADFFAQQAKTYPNPFEAFIHAPGLFWLNTSAGMIAALSWVGLAAAVAVVLNLWPRLSLSICWLIFLSFVTSWRAFSPAQLDKLMLEVALLCIPFAPAGLRPGLGAASPPRPITVFMLRWMLFRVMFESGIVKLISSDSRWRNFTAMEVMYETSPFPTFLGYLDHHMSHAYHLFEIALTFMAEVFAPLLAVFGARRGRWWALALWVALQVGIQLTCNFGWLNTASIGLGLLLLDDQMLAVAFEWLKLRAWSGRGAQQIQAIAPRITPAWSLYGLRVGLGLHFCLTIFYFAKDCGVPVGAAPAIITEPVSLLSEFRSANGYCLYAAFGPVRYQAELEGSNDGGATWRSFEYRFLPQQPDRICLNFAPWFARFEATIQIETFCGVKSPLLPIVAARLMERNPDVINLFARDPFPDQPPTLIRLRCYRFSFTELEVQRKTGRYWRKEFVGDYLPTMFRNEKGQVDAFDLKPGDHAMRRGDYTEARTIFEKQYQLGNFDAGIRLAEIYGRGLGVVANPAKTFAIYSDLARKGDMVAKHCLGACYEHGVGAPIDNAKAALEYRDAADQGYLLSLYSLGSLYARRRLAPENDLEGLTLMLEAQERAVGDDPLARYIRDDQPGFIKRLEQRLTPSDVDAARQQAAIRIKYDNPTGRG